jgi:hypothetical protein
MKINRGAIIFIIVLGGLALIIAGVIAFSSLFQKSSGGVSGNIDELFSSLFPFGQSTPRQLGGSASTDGGGQTGPVPVLREISREPVAGFYIASSSVIRYAEVNTGHIYETPTNSLAVTRRTNTTFAGVQNAVWVSENSVVYQRADADVITNSLVSFSTSSIDQLVVGRPLSGFRSVAVSPNVPRVVTTTRSLTNTTVSVTDQEENQRRVVFTSPIKSWTAFPAGNEVYVETSPSDGAGFLFKVLQGGGLEKIRGGLRGLMAVARPDGQYFALSTVTEGAIRLEFIDAFASSVGTSPVATLAEKCAWFASAQPLLACGVPQTPTNVSVESWYMGLRSFTDDVWIIDPIKETATFVRSLEGEAGRPIDIIDPQVSPDGRYFLFKNKNDLSLWSLDLGR